MNVDVEVLDYLLAQTVPIESDEARQQGIQHELLVRTELHTCEGGNAVQEQL